MRIVVATFAFGCLFLQVVVGGSVSPSPHELRLPVPHAGLLLCWPIDFERHAVWPPIEAAISSEDFKHLAGARTRIANAGATGTG